MKNRLALLILLLLPPGKEPTKFKTWLVTTPGIFSGLILSTWALTTYLLIQFGAWPAAFTRLDSMAASIVALGICGLVVGPLFETKSAGSFIEGAIPVFLALEYVGGSIALLALPAETAAASLCISFGTLVWSDIQFARFQRAVRKTKTETNGHFSVANSIPPSGKCAPSFFQGTGRTIGDGNKLKTWRTLLVFEHKSEVHKDTIVLTNRAGGFAFYGLWWNTKGVKIETLVKLECFNDGESCKAVGSVEGPTEGADGIVRVTTAVAEESLGHIYKCSASMGAALNATGGPKISPPGLPISIDWPSAAHAATNAMGSYVGKCDKV